MQCSWPSGDLDDKIYTASGLIGSGRAWNLRTPEAKKPTITPNFPMFHVPMTFKLEPEEDTATWTFPLTFTRLASGLIQGMRKATTKVK